MPVDSKGTFADSAGLLDLPALRSFVFRAQMSTHLAGHLRVATLQHDLRALRALEPCERHGRVTHRLSAEERRREEMAVEERERRVGGAHDAACCAVERQLRAVAVDCH